MFASGLAPLPDHAGDDLGQPGARRVPPREDLLLPVRIQDRRGRDRHLEVVEERAELVGELRAELASHQAVGRRPKHQLLELLVEVLLPRFPPLGDPFLHLPRHDLGVALHEAQCQRVGLHLHLLALDLEGRAELDSLAEDRDHVLVGLRRGELFVGRAEYRLLGVGSDQEHVLHAAQVELGDLSALLPGPQHEARRVGQELLVVPGAGLRAAHDPAHRALDRLVRSAHVPPPGSSVGTPPTGYPPVTGVRTHAQAMGPRKRAQRSSRTMLVIDTKDASITVRGIDQRGSPGLSSSR